MDDSSTETMGPVELAVVEFPGTSFQGEVADALADLVDREIVSIIDLLVVIKGDEGDLEVIELTDPEGVIPERFAKLEGEVMWLLSDEDIAAAASTLHPGTNGVLVVWENTWARNLRTAVGRSGGRLVVHDRLDPREVAEAIAASPGV